MKILVIDDEMMNCEIIQEHLEDEGFEVVCAGDGYEGGQK